MFSVCPDWKVCPVLRSWAGTLSPPKGKHVLFEDPKKALGKQMWISWAPVLSAHRALCNPAPTPTCSHSVLFTSKPRRGLIHKHYIHLDTGVSSKSKNSISLTLATCWLGFLMQTELFCYRGTLRELGVQAEARKVSCHQWKRKFTRTICILQTIIFQYLQYH